MDISPQPEPTPATPQPSAITERLQSTPTSPHPKKRWILVTVFSIAVCTLVLGSYFYYRHTRATETTESRANKKVSMVIDDNHFPTTVPTDTIRNGENVHLSILDTSVRGDTIAYSITDVPNKSLEIYANGILLNRLSSNVDIPKIIQSSISDDGSLVAYTVDMITKIDETAPSTDNNAYRRSIPTYVNNVETAAAPGSFSFLPHSNQYGYVEVNPDGNSRRAVINSLAGKTYDYIWKIQYSQDREHNYYVARIDDKAVRQSKDIVVKDGVELDAPCILNCLFATSPDGQHYAFYGIEESGDTADIILTVDDKHIRQPRIRGRNSVTNLVVTDTGDYTYLFSKNLDNMQDKLEINLYLNDTIVYTETMSRATGYKGIKANSVQILDSERIFFIREDTTNSKVAYYINDANISGWVDADSISEPAFDESGTDVYYVVLDTTRKIAKLIQNEKQFATRPIFPSGPWFTYKIIRPIPGTSQVFFQDTDKNSVISVIDTKNGEQIDTLDANNLTEIWFSPNKANYCWVHEGKLHISGNKSVAENVIGTPRYADDSTIVYYTKNGNQLSKGVYKLTD